MDPSRPAPPHLTEALPDLAAWSAHFLAAPLPVLDDTALRLEQLRAAEDAVDAHLIAEAVALMWSEQPAKKGRYARLR